LRPLNFYLPILNDLYRQSYSQYQPLLKVRSPHSAHRYGQFLAGVGADMDDLLFEPTIVWLAIRLNARIESEKMQAMFQSPNSPIEAMWLQYRKWFDLSSEKARTNRLFA
jgi:hypothetical protein